KTGQGIDELLAAICERVPGPRGHANARTQALIFDSEYDDYRGVITYFRLINGKLQTGDRIRMMGTGRVYPIADMGKFTPKMTSYKQPMAAGEVGYLVANIKTLDDVNIGDTITLDNQPADEAL